jgi:methionyl-tRNA synthetase
MSWTFREILGLLNMSNYRFIRTVEDHHKGAVWHFWRTLVDAGAVYLGSYEGRYSVQDECYYNESKLVDGRAPTGAEVSWVKKEDLYFFRLSEYADCLLEHYKSHPHFIVPESCRNKVVSFVRGGLRDLSISRTTFDWGVRVPGNEGHVMYMWINALANYISALGYPEETGDGSDFDRF